MLEIVGVITLTIIAALAAALLFHIAGNIYGGIKGAYRLRYIKMKYQTKPIRHWPTIRLGMRAWTGMRYKDGFGTYWQLGGLKVPIDGRDKIDRDRFWGT